MRRWRPRLSVRVSAAKPGCRHGVQDVASRSARVYGVGPASISGAISSRSTPPPTAASRQRRRGVTSSRQSAPTLGGSAGAGRETVGSPPLSRRFRASSSPHRRPATAPPSTSSTPTDSRHARAAGDLPRRTNRQRRCGRPVRRRSRPGVVRARRHRHHLTHRSMPRSRQAAGTVGKQRSSAPRPGAGRRGRGASQPRRERGATAPPSRRTPRLAAPGRRADGRRHDRSA